MERKTFSLTLPIDLCDSLDEEAFKTFRKKNARNQMIFQIVAEWHEKKRLERTHKNGDTQNESLSLQN